MTSRDDMDYLLLFDQYLQGDLNDENANRLLNLVRTDSTIRAAWKDSVLADFLLRQKAQIQKHLLDEARLPDWDELIDQLRTSEPIVHKTSEEKERPPHDPKLSQDTQSQISPVTTKRPPKQTWTRHLPLIISITALLALIVPAEWRHFYQTTGESFVAVASISEVVDPVWRAHTETFKRRQELARQKLSLESGLVKIVYKTGAQIVLEGPSEFLVSGDNDGWCESGSLSAHVPPSAAGFEVKTPFASVIDRGTDFALYVNEEQVEISVINGKIDLRQTGIPDITVTTGSGQKYLKGGIIQPISAQVDRYIDRDQFQHRLDRYIQRVEQVQKELAVQMEAHPNLLVRFLLNSDRRNEIPNRSRRGVSTVAQAHVQNCIAEEGSLPGSESLRFNRRDSKVTFTLPVEMSDLTMVASVCVDQPANHGNVLASSDEHGQTPGSFLWQLAADGRFFFHVTGNGKEINFHPSPVVLSPAKRHTWSQIAVVADSMKKEIRFYQDGKQVGRNDWNNPVRLVPGNMTLGNVAVQGKLTARFLNGAMENFALFDRALSSEEISKLTWND